jgi:3-phosphoshikimate 1-carboxyvinyltransferase
MILKIKPTSALKGRIYLPASKSYTIRAFLIAACGGTSVIKKPSNCDDAKAALDAARALGSAVIDKGNGAWQIKAGNGVKIKRKINVRESGTALRFLLPLLSLKEGAFTVEGKGTLRGRPNKFLIETISAMGKSIAGTGPQHGIPIKINGGDLKGGKVFLDGSLSSQFVSALLIACPQIKEDTHLYLKGDKLVSTDYITMTLQVLKKAGIEILPVGKREFLIKGGQKFKGLRPFHVPSDYGLAGFHFAAAALTDSDVVFNGNFDPDFIQADGHIIDFMQRMGVDFIRTAGSIRIKGPFSLKGGRFSLKDCPDLVPVMAVLAMFAKGKTRLTDIGHARVKESDRITDLRNELIKTGAVMIEKSNEMTIIPQVQYKNGCTLDPHHDHRLAMAFAVLGLKIGVNVKDMECCGKSYPDFVKDFKILTGSK